MISEEAYRFKMPKKRPTKPGFDAKFPGIEWFDFGSVIFHPCIPTLRGRIFVEDGDWIVRIGMNYFPLALFNKTLAF